jgi:hypothetical protein
MFRVGAAAAAAADQEQEQEEARPTLPQHEAQEIIHIFCRGHNDTLL